MNVLHMKYAVEVAKAGSINKAAGNLLVAQPNLSRSIKELEESLGIAIFDRSAKGMSLTPEGEEFIGYAKAILNQIDDVEKRYRDDMPKKQKFSISVPRATYISEAFARFSKTLAGNPAELIYRETNSFRTIKNITEDGYKLGIVRYAAEYDQYFKAMLKEKDLAFELVAEFRYVLAMGQGCPLAELPQIRLSDLRPYIEIAHADPYVPSLPTAVVRKATLSEDIRRRIFVFERASEFDILSENPEAFMWVSPLPDRILTRYGLVQRQCSENTKTYKDILIRPKNYRLSKLDRKFLTELDVSKQRHLSQTL